MPVGTGLELRFEHSLKTDTECVFFRVRPVSYRTNENKFKTAERLHSEWETPFRGGPVTLS